MHFTSFHIKKLKLSNFLSFFDVQEVHIEPLTAIMCNYSEGRSDLLRALDFVFGANVKEIQVATPKHMLHKVLWKEFDYEKTVPCFVEVTLELLPKCDPVILYRGLTKRGFEYKIDDKLVSQLKYEEVLNSLNLSNKLKNIIFHKDLFYDVIWGHSADLERTITKILRSNCYLDEWKKAREKMKYLQESKNSLTEKTHKKVEKSHGIIEKFVDKFNSIEITRDIFRKSLKLEEILEDDSFQSDTSGTKTEPLEDLGLEVLQDTAVLEEERESLFDRCRSLQKKEKLLYCKLFFSKLKASGKPKNTVILQEQIKRLKAKLGAQENSLSLFWTKMSTVDKELKDLEHRISNDLGYLWGLQQTVYLKNKFSMYGRFIDYFQPNTFVDTLRKILGDEIIFGNLCDDFPEAVFYSNLLKGMKYQKREHFLIFNNYPPEFKDLLMASGESSLEIKSIQELQILLCKLKQYGVIQTVPITTERRFNFKLEEGKNYDADILYCRDGIFLKSDGLIIYAADNQVNFETEESLLQRVNLLLIQQAVKFEEYRDLIFNRSETLLHILDLENDILHLKCELNKHTQCEQYKRFVEMEKIQISSIYDEYADLFEEHQQGEITLREIEDSEETQQYLMTDDDRDNSDIESLLDSISEALDEIESENIRTKRELSELDKKLRILDLTSNTEPVQPITKFFPFEPQKMSTYIYYEKEMENLKLLMSKNEVEEFEGWKDWRKKVINSLVQNMGTTDNSMKESKQTLERMTASRKKILSPFLEHCAHHLTPTVNLLMDTAIPFLDLTLNQSEDGLQLYTSLQEDLIDFIDVSSLNTFLKFIAALSLFLEIAIYDKIPILFFDDLKEFFPRHKDDFEIVLGEKTFTRIVDFGESARFQIIMRVVQFFEFFIKKNATGNSIRNNGNKKGNNGPAQIIYFTSDEFVHFAQHQLWIHSELLPDKYITNSCDSYSSLQEIHFN